jgi:hypothetical protein
MGRFEDDGDWGDSPRAILDQGRWEHNIPLSIKGKRGQAALRFLESALIAMPEKRLVSGWLATPDGECCTVGLYVAAKEAAKREIPLRQAAQTIALETYPEEFTGLVRVAPGKYADDYGILAEDESGQETTIDAGKAAGLTGTLTWVLGDLNDCSYGHLSPEQRYEKVLKWVRAELKRSSEGD